MKKVCQINFMSSALPNEPITQVMQFPVIIIIIIKNVCNNFIIIIIYYGEEVLIV